MSEPIASPSPEAIHAILQDAYERLTVLRGSTDQVSTDSAFAIGECVGQLAKAKALVGRDIDIDTARQTLAGKPDAETGKLGKL